MKTLADFKKRISVGVQLHTIFHQAHGGRTETGLIVLMDQDKGVRPVTISQGNAFALGTVQPDGSTVDAWCYYPKAGQIKFEGANTATIYTEDFRSNSPTYNQMIPCLTYTIVE